MYKIMRVSPNRVEIVVTGKLDRDSMQKLLADFLSQSESVRDGKLLIRIQGFEFPTIGGILAKLMQMPHLLRSIRNFRKTAVIAEAGWLRALGELEGLLFPGMDVKSFADQDEVAAQAWLVG